ncbi:MFS transporter [Hoyosella altamirensis]|uniref:MFS family permease n=1 Tax=Hoyosella altamirensis TaxID=616997 RepID=A0A839RS98_9ACTN|nr:MFS transporter [Hoyosella altamirensis]MBB3039078.1 MFS family permease [Hoyosella altamirensis]
MKGFALYREMWQIPGAPSLVSGGFVARLGQGVTVIAWLLLVRETRGSYSEAALVASAISLATACAAPVAGRLADRFSACKVLPYYAVTYSMSQLALLAAVLTGQPMTLLVTLAIVSGASFPPVSPAVRATWSVLTSPASGRAPLRPTAMAAESAMFEFVFVIGPLILSTSILAAGLFAGAESAALSGPALALGGSAVCTLLGTLWISRGTAMRAARTPSAGFTRGLGPLRSGRFVVLLVSAAGVALSFGAAPVALAAHAEEQHGLSGGAVTGVLIAVWSLGSAAVGLWFGSLRLLAPLRSQYLVLLAGLGAGYALWVVAPSTWLLGVLLVFTGGVIAPALAVTANLVAELTPEAMRNEAYTWLTTTNMAIAALGAAIAGFVVEHPPMPSFAAGHNGFLLCAVAVLFALAAAIFVRVPTRGAELQEVAA